MSDIDNVISGKNHEQQHHQQQHHSNYHNNQQQQQQQHQQLSYPQQYSVTFAPFEEELGGGGSSGAGGGRQEEEAESLPLPPPPSLVSTFPQASHSNATNLQTPHLSHTTTTASPATSIVTTTAITSIANPNVNDKQITTTLTKTTTTTATTRKSRDSSREKFLKSSNRRDPIEYPEHSEDSDEESRNCFGIFLKILFSTPGLICLVISYSLLGALMFPLLEAPQDINKLDMISKSREDCLKELWIITEKLNVLYERNWTMLVHEQLRRFEGSIVAATRSGVSNVNSIVDSKALSTNVKSAPGASPTGTMGYLSGNAHTGGGGLAGGTGSGSGNGAISGTINDATLIGDGHWTFSEALIYSVTVITTIGHGSLTPKTTLGKVATIFYALIGVPLMLMCLSSLGALLAEALQCTYIRLCCRLSAEHSSSEDNSRSHSHSHTHTHSHTSSHSRNHNHRHRLSNSNKTSCRRGSGQLNSSTKHYRQCRKASLETYTQDDYENGRNLLLGSGGKLKTCSFRDADDFDANDAENICVGVKEVGFAGLGSGHDNGSAVKFTHENKPHFSQDPHKQTLSTNSELRKAQTQPKIGQIVKNLIWT